ncbi:MAG TPA: chondroitin polymerase, partial [Cytophagales bacterium]|nr:chondroitin polymerase [Cytophagales bacterium]
MNEPLVSVTCLCYNHARYVQEAIQSVLNQSYPHIELVVVDDASTDDSVAAIEHALVGRADVQFTRHERNVGYTRSFNKAWKLCSGEFVIDLAADDVLRPDRVARGVAALQQAGPAYGIQFSDGEYIDAAGETQGLHSIRFPHDYVPQGDVYEQVISRYFILSPSVMMRQSVLVALEGYDETLAYEDFDLWIRAARDFKFLYLPQPLVKKRILSSSMSAAQFVFRSPQQETTYRVLHKAMKLNRT